jgi:hypothetical protein
VNHFVIHMSDTERTERKERVIHTRVPESLEAELKDRAAEMGVSVSNLVRNVLAHALGMVNVIVADSEQIVRSARDSIEAGVRAVRGQPPTPAVPAAPAQVLGWQAAVLEKNAVCDSCNEILPRGSDAAIAIFDGPAAGPRPILCLLCLEELRHAPKP